MLALLFNSCALREWIITESKGKRIPLDASTEQIADVKVKEMIKPYKEKLDNDMNVVIGYAVENMRGHAPESLLSNFSADVYREAAAAHLKRPVEIAIVNMGGLRTQIPAGKITIGKVFELMPFENELVIVWLKGSELLGLLNYFASIGGEGVSGLKMGINNGKAVDVTVGGEVLNPDKIYGIATNDYLSEGNDGMVQLTRFEMKVKTGIKVRDMLIAHIRALTAAGKKVEAKIEGRVNRPR